VWKKRNCVILWAKVDGITDSVDFHSDLCNFAAETLKMKKRQTDANTERWL